MIVVSGGKILHDILRREKRKIKNSKLKLLVVLIGNDKISRLYIKKKKEFCDELGIGFKLAVFKSTIKKSFLSEGIKELCRECDGAIIQLPIPKRFNTDEVLKFIPPEKDIDALSSDIFLSPIVGAVSYIFKKYQVPFKKIIVIGKGRLVGKPLAKWLAKNKADFEIMDKKIKVLKLKKARVIISGVGKPIIKSNMVTDGAVLIDVGNHYKNNKVIGDISKSSYKKASIVVPVPGGIGKLTIYFLVKNLLRAKKFRFQKTK